MNKIRKTNERCYICDFRRATSGVNETDGSTDDDIIGLYQNGLVSIYQDQTGRFVFIDPRDGKPVCTQCAAVARNLVRELEWRDRGYKAKSWKESQQDIFKEWERRLNESLRQQPAHDAENEEQTERETT